MAEPFNHERLEAVITRALRLRADAEPRDGLEQRVIAIMRSQAVEAVGQRRPWAWMAGALATATLLLFALLEIRHQPVVRPSSIANQRMENKNIAQGVSGVMPHGHVLRGRSAASRISPSEARSAILASQARLATFPAPAPLSADEKSLVAWLQRAPAASASGQAVAQNSERNMAPGKDPFALTEDAQPKFTELAFLYPQDHAREDSKKYDRGGPR